MLASLWAYLPSLLVLLFISAFFSASEASLFSLSLAQRRSLTKGSAGGRLAQGLLERSDRLLMGILFWNLTTNVTFFSIVSKAVLVLEESQTITRSGAAVITSAALVSVIIFGEFLPKTLAVLMPVQIAQLVAVPLSIAIRILDPLLPIIRVANEASRRLLWPGLKPEPYLELTDLNRVVELSAQDDSLIDFERLVLQNIIQLSDIHVQEWMRPRIQFRTFVPPISLEQLGGQRTPSGYMLVTDKRGREVTYAIDLKSLKPEDFNRLDSLKRSVIIIPWCSTMADAFKRLRDEQRKVAAIVNELGETIGILTWEDIFEAILHVHTTKSHREFAKAEIHQAAEDVWIATGMTRLRRLEREINYKIPDGTNLTVVGAIQENLSRLPHVGDACMLGRLLLEVIEEGDRGEILVRLTLNPTNESGGAE